MSFWKKLLYRIIYPASLIFTVISLIIYAIWASEEGGNTTAVLFFVLTAYALFVAFVSCIFFTEMIMPLKIIVHFGALFLSLCIFCAAVCGAGDRRCCRCWPPSPPQRWYTDEKHPLGQAA